MKSILHRYETAWRLGTAAQLDDNAKAPRNNWKTVLNASWSRIMAFLSVSSDPYIWTAVDASGQVVWNAYDPQAGRRVERLSEREMTIWLEERYYQAGCMGDRTGY